MTPTNNITTPAADQHHLVRHKRDRWLFTFDHHAEKWNGCHKSLEEAINHALEYRADYYIEHFAPVYLALGAPTPKRECEEMGVEWPWYQIDTSRVIRIYLPNNQTPTP